MSTIQKIPTTADIYLEVDGTKVAIVQSYSVVTSRDSKSIAAFGQNEPVATIRGENTYALALSRIYATDDALVDGLNFHDMEDFSLVVCKPDVKVIYAGCQWSKLEESATVGGTVLEEVAITATSRVEVAV
ncbi:MAG: hypothetical protein R3Y62_00930 [Eubacteriales bacterium]